MLNVDAESNGEPMRVFPFCTVYIDHTKVNKGRVTGSKAIFVSTDRRYIDVSMYRIVYLLLLNMQR